MFPDMALDPQAWGILALTPRLPTKVGGGGGEPVMETSSLLSEMTETQTISLTTLFPTR